MIGNRIKEIREENGLPQKDFGETLGLKPLQIIRYEKGEQVPSAKVLEQISLKYGVTIDWLVTGLRAKYLRSNEIVELEEQLLEQYRHLAKGDKKQARQFIEFLTHKKQQDKE